MGTVSPEKILKELADLWVSQGKRSQHEGGDGVLRACTMTLVVASESSDDSGSMGETIAALMPEHPARTILIRLSGAGAPALEERVYAQCWMPFGQRRQICCEQIEITASDAALVDVPPVVLPLVAADLPLILWCRSARIFAMPAFGGLAALARKIVLDSAGFADSADALKQLSEAVGRGCMLGDLGWTRLTRWRQMLAQIFENRENLASVDKVAQVTVEYPGEKPTTSSYYLGAWVMDCLAGIGVKAELSLTAGAWAGHGEAPRVLRVLLEGPGISVELSRWEDRMVTTVNGLAQCVNLPVVTEYSLLREEQGIVRRDPVFEKTLASALRLAYAKH
jgi:glucose-6-phosphate dehydrogenase assembly protein OpcA